MEELIRIEERNGVPTVNARELHTFLEVGRKFAGWIKGRIKQYDFIEGKDYLRSRSGYQVPSGTKYSIEYHLTLTMGKELAMVENNKRGHQIRKWFIDKQEQLDAMRPTVRPIEYNKTQLYLTPREIVEMFRISLSTVKRMRERGELKPVSVTKHLYRYRVEDVERLISGTPCESQALLPFDNVD